MIECLYGEVTAKKKGDETLRALSKLFTIAIWAQYMAIIAIIITIISIIVILIFNCYCGILISEVCIVLWVHCLW